MIYAQAAMKELAPATSSSSSSVVVDCAMRYCPPMCSITSPSGRRPPSRLRLRQSVNSEVLAATDDSAGRDDHWTQNSSARRCHKAITIVLEIWAGEHRLYVMSWLVSPLVSVGHGQGTRGWRMVMSMAHRGWGRPMQSKSFKAMFRSQDRTKLVGQDGDR